MPSYLLRQQAGKKSKSGSLDDDFKKANVIQKKFKNKSLSPQAMEELEKLMTDDPTANQALILKEMDYLKDVDNMHHTLQGLYPNPNSLKSYNNVLTIIASHLKVFNKFINN